MQTSGNHRAGDTPGRPAAPARTDLVVANEPVPASFYVTGGTLRADAPCYVQRPADEELLRRLLQAEYCYVLTPRQMGKSSLMVRTASRLRRHRCATAVLDLTAIGQNLTPAQWYEGLMASLGRQLDLEEEIEAFCQAGRQLSPVQRFFLVLEQVILERCPGTVVLFIDEIDVVRSLPFSTDEFFAGIRECHNRRALDPAFRRLAFVLLGVARPTDLIHDRRTTPFNIGQRVPLHDFTVDEAAVLAHGLAPRHANAATLLQRVLHWTGGHPYLTQRLCAALADRPAPARAQAVDELCAELFLGPGVRERDDNLVATRERLLVNTPHRAALLALYDRVRRGRAIADRGDDPLLDALQLTGVVRSAGGRLQIRNRIYEEVFDRRWLAANTAGPERRGRRIAARQGALCAVAAIVALLLLVNIRWFSPAPHRSVAIPGFTNHELNLPLSGLGTTVPPSGGALILRATGAVEVSRAGSASWDPAYARQLLKPGDRIRAHTRSSAELLLHNGARVSLDPATLLELTTQDSAPGRSLLDVLEGTLQSLTRPISTKDPQSSGTSGVSGRIRG